MAPSLTGRGWGWVGFLAAEAVSQFPGPPLEDPPTSPPRNSTGARGGSAVGRLAHGLPLPHGRRSVAADVPARLAQRLQRSRPNDTSSGGSAAEVPPSAATGAAVEPLRAIRCNWYSAARLRAWRVTGVAFGTREHRAERSAATCECGPIAKRASVLRSRTDEEARDPRARERAATCFSRLHRPDRVASGMEARQGARRRYPGGSTRSATARPRAAGRRPGP